MATQHAPVRAEPDVNNNVIRVCESLSRIHRLNLGYFSPLLFSVIGAVELTPLLNMASVTADAHVGNSQEMRRGDDGEFRTVEILRANLGQQFSYCAIEHTNPRSTERYRPQFAREEEASPSGLAKAVIERNSAGAEDHSPARRVAFGNEL